MKLMILLLSLLLILAPITLALKEKPVLKDYGTVKEFVDEKYGRLKSDKIPDEQLTKLKMALPVSLKLVITDTNETLFFKIDKKGAIVLPESMRKVDLEVITTKNTFFEIVAKGSSLTEAEIKNFIQEDKITVIAHSLKAQIAIQFLEDRFGLAITKKKTFRANTIAFLAAKFASLFIKKNA